MKTPFQLIDEIRKDYKPYKLEPDDGFSAFLMQRGISMASPTAAYLVNQTTNMMWDVLDNQMYMDIWKLMIPKSRTRIEWMKKSEITDKQREKNKRIGEMARILERSEKTVRMYLELDPNFLDQFEEKSSIRKKSE